MSEKREYSTAPTRYQQKYHKTPMEQIRALYILVGWVGERRAPVRLTRLPVFDKGPGVQL